MLDEGRAFWPAGTEVTYQRPPSLVNLSVSPTERKEAQPLFGSASKQEELEIGEKKIEDEEIPVPLISEGN